MSQLQSPSQKGIKDKSNAQSQKNHKPQSIKRQGSQRKSQANKLLSEAENRSTANNKVKAEAAEKSEKQVSHVSWEAAYQNQGFNIEVPKNKGFNKQLPKQKEKDMSEVNWEAVHHNQMFHLGQLKKAESKSMTKKNSNEMQWEAAYIDEKFYLSDPHSLARLRQLQMEIEAEKKKLANIENVDRLDNSFLSQQNFNDQLQNLDSRTQINQSRLLKRKQNAEADLLKQQQKYRNKLEQMKKKKSILKKEIGCGTNEKNMQVNSEQIAKQQQQLLKKQQKRIQNEKQKKQSQKNGPNRQQEKNSAIKAEIKSAAQSNKNTNAKLQKQASTNQIVDKAKSKANFQKQQQKSQKISRSKQKSKVSQKIQQILPEMPTVAKSVKSSALKSQKIQPNKKLNQQTESNKLQIESPEKSQKQKQKSRQGQLQIPLNQQASPKQKSVASKTKSKKQQILNHIESSQLANIEIQKSKKSDALNAVDSPSKKGDKKQKSLAEKSQKNPIQKQSNHLFVPQIKTNKQNSFKKTDKSVQWEQLEPSMKNLQVEKSVQVSKFQSNAQLSRVSQNKTEKQASEIVSKASPKTKNQNKQLQVQKSEKQRSQRSSVKPSQKLVPQYTYTVTKVEDQRLEGNKTNKQKSVRDSRIDQKSETSKKVSEARSKKYEDNHSQKPTSQKPSEIASSRIKQQAVSSKHEDAAESFDQDIMVAKQINQEEQNEQHDQQFSKDQRQSNSHQASMSQSQLVSDKKRTSFKIHSRQNSVKSKKSRQPSAEKQKKIEFAESYMPSISNKMQSAREIQTPKSQTEQLKNLIQIKKLHDQIGELQQKLKRVEEKQEKQEQMIRFENNQSRIMSDNLEASQPGSEPASPLGKINLTSRLKLQNKLSLEASTVQFNTFQQKLKKTAQENEKLQKLRLQEQIGRLKKVIRDMQMEKIKSIQYQPSSSSKVQLRKPSILDQNQNNNSRVSQKWKESLNSDMLETKRNEWNTETFNKEKQQAGKIKRNSPYKFQIQSPRKYNKANAEKSKQFSQITPDQQQKQQIPLPLRRKAESVHGGGVGRSRDLSKSELINKFEQNQKNFHQFLQSSRLVGHQPESIMQQTNQSLGQPYQKLHQRQMPSPKNPSSPQSPPQSPSHIANYSSLVSKLKHENPQDNPQSPQIPTLPTLSFPQLPETPNIGMSQQQLLELAKRVYLLFGINVEEDQTLLCMKKYKNCVVFVYGGEGNTILWHYSGKFYMGGWRSVGEPGEGEKIGQGVEYVPGKHLYKGQFLGGKKNGNGIVKMNNGNVYDGQWVDGTKNGRGVYFQASTGTYYNGEWRDGKRDGYGILKFSNNQFYEGTFSKSIKQGYGVQKFANGDYYKGQYQKGKFHGKGKYCWSNGSSYEGDFIQGCRHGQGSWKSSRKGGDIYVGAYQNDKKCGYGRYVWSNGCVYEGYFRNDLKNGKGRLVYQDGKQIKGTWQDGNLISADQQARKVQQHQQQPLRRSIRASSLKSPQNSFSNSYRKPVHL